MTQGRQKPHSEDQLNETPFLKTTYIQLTWKSRISFTNSINSNLIEKSSNMVTTVSDTVLYI